MQDNRVKAIKRGEPIVHYYEHVIKIFCATVYWGPGHCWPPIHLYCVFTYIYSLLIEKYLCECRNVSVKFAFCLLVYFIWRPLHFFGNFPFLFLFLRVLAVTLSYCKAFFWYFSPRIHITYVNNDGQEVNCLGSIKLYI